MRTLPTVLVILLCMFATIAHSEDCVTSQTPLVQLLNQYSQEHGTKFVIDPRVRANVTLVGIDPAVLDTGTLVGVLNIHGFTAFTKEGVVYVMPEYVAEVSGEKYGRRWDG